MAPQGVWWTRRSHGVKFDILFVGIAGLLALGEFGRGMAI